MQKMLLRVVVPDGLVPGDDFTISAPSCCGAREFEVSVPKGACGGVTIDVEVPDDGDHRVIVVVPPGLQPGDPFNVEAAWGTFEVCVPDGVAAGEAIEVELPPPEQPSEPALSPSPSPPRCPPVGKTALADVWEWEDELNGEGRRPSEQQQQAQQEAYRPAAGRYTPGERVKVKRSSGAWTPGRVVEYDEVGDNYTVEVLPSGVLKHLVSESELSHMNFQQERAGEHWIGRRVQVPCVGAESRDDVFGEVRSHDPTTDTYTVALDSGVIKRHLISDEIRVRDPATRRRPAPGEST